MSGRTRLTLFALLATLLTALSLAPLVASQAWMLQACWLLAVQSGVGALCRRVPLPRSLTVAAQLLVSLLLLVLLFAGEGRSGGAGAQLFTGIGTLYQEGLADVGEYAIPAPQTDGIRLLLVSGVLLIGLLVDLLAVTFRTAAAAGLPLLALYSVAAGLSGGNGWLLFVLAGTGYLLLLLAESGDRLAQWGRVFGGGARGPGGSGSAGRQPVAPVRTGRRIGAVAVLIALGAAYVLPTPEGGLLGPGGEGGGSGPGGGTISAVNPLVALQSSLTAQDDRVVLRYRTDNKQPDQYLRIVSLDEFDGVEWKSSGRSLTEVPDRLPRVPGLSDQVRLGGTEVRTSVSAAGDYVQRYLPMPYPATQVEIKDGRWRFEQVGRTVIGDDLGKGKKQTVQGAQYTVSSLALRPTAQQLSSAPKPPAAFVEEFTRLPADMPPVVAETARSVTRGAKDDYAKALKLQNWFAVKENGGFTYNTKTSSGSGSQAIVRFLKEKEGFCVHFSFSMASMARSLGIPARVAVGFTPGSALADGSMQVTMKDAHAWPELYFEGVGWTRFEPTPTRGTAPDYTRAETPVTQPTAPAPLPSQSSSAPAPAPSSSADSCPPELRRLGDCDSAAAPGAGPEGGDFPWGTVLGFVGLGLLVAAVPLLPLLWRGRVRARRLGCGEPLAAWRELGDMAWDVGITPDEALSPRRAAARIVELGSLEPPAAEAVHRLAGAVERVLYARPGAVVVPVADGDAAADVLVARAGLLAGVGRGRRLRALLLPRSAARLGWAASARWTALAGRAAALVAKLPRLKRT
ncbi:transglutaminase [Streptomyces venezuelae]|uniref:Transglutaminase n=1 Tax=Streptomyces venezuelae TaxID=54571 RepID=A0A5P2D708_STRVZ|nr:DUF3488 and transglutaminase-like domain-containing protein [Streptomyces venezuelae]QES50543.1 transglutaminase [Streptomyces venezuelae]